MFLGADEQGGPNYIWEQLAQDDLSVLWGDDSDFLPTFSQSPAIPFMFSGELGAVGMVESLCLP